MRESKAEVLGGGQEQEREIRERALDAAIETAIVMHARRINEGTRGVIFQLDLSHLEGQITELLGGGSDLEGESAVKLLKVYTPGVGRREFEMQSKAFQVVEQMTGEKALIPKPRLFREIQITEESRKHLKSFGVNAIDKVEVMVMDLVDGVDLADFIAGKALQLALPEIYPDDDSVRNMTLDQMHANLEGRRDKRGNTLHFYQPGGKGAQEGEREFERRKVQEQNTRQLYQFLQSFDFSLDRSVLTRLSNTMTSLHKARIAHRDLYERNVMLGNDGNVFLIDFGTTTTFSGDYAAETENIYKAEDGTRWDQDEAMLDRLKEICSTKEERAEDRQSEQLDEFLSPIEKKRKDREWVEKRDRYLAKTDLSDTDALKEFIKNIAGHYLWDVRTLSHKKASHRHLTLFADFVLTAAEAGLADIEQLISEVQELSGNIKMQITTEEKLVNNYYQSLLKKLRLIREGAD